MASAKITIRKGREKPIRNRHPWIFSGAIATAANALDGQLITIVDHKDRFLARGYWNSKSQIQARILTWEDEAIDDCWWRRMLSRAWQLRAQSQAGLSDDRACRIVNAENDYLPGLVLDRYGEYFVLQAQTFFIDRHKEKIAEILRSHFDAKHVFERSDIELRRHEGLHQTVGALVGNPPPDSLVINEGPRYHVDIIGGQKTGFYLDQRCNRQKLHELVQGSSSAGDSPPSLLNLFSYSGGFAIAAQRDGNLRAVNVDSSRAALELAEKNFALNAYDKSLSGASAEYIQADSFDYLRYCLREGTRFDYVVLDPPKFAQQKRQAARAARGYKDLNLNAFRLVKEGGYMMTFSCSGAISRDLFQKIVFAALADSGRQAQIVERLSAAPDHPVALTFPEGDYLKGLLLRVY